MRNANPGGTGAFKDVTLNTSAYDAVYRGKADFTLPLATWEVIQARLVGKPLKTFKLSSYGVPPEYSALIASSNAYLQANPALARRVSGFTSGAAWLVPGNDSTVCLVAENAQGLAMNSEPVQLTVSKFTSTPLAAGVHDAPESVETSTSPLCPTIT